MKISNYFFKIKEKINKINTYISNPNNYKNLNNPFSSSITKTYIWIDETKKH